jgi:hypothetical protein
LMLNLLVPPWILRPLLVVPLEPLQPRFILPLNSPLNLEPLPLNSLPSAFQRPHCISVTWLSTPHLQH